MSPTLVLRHMPTSMVRRVVVALTILALFLTGLAIATGAPSPAAAATTPYASLAKQMVTKINKLRVARHLPALKLDTRLSSAALPHSRQMAKHHSYAKHFTGETQMAPALREHNFYPKTVAEALGSGKTKGSLLNRPAQLASSSWSSVLGKSMSTVGIGIVHSKNRYWVTVVVAQQGTATPAELGSSWAQSLLQMLNDERQDNGLPALTMNAKLIQSAHAHNLDMAAQNTMSHQLPGEAYFADRIQAAGYNYQYAGENIGWNSVQTLDGVRQLEQIMYDEKAPDDGHRQNILSKNYVNVGIDIYIDNANGKVWLTEDFGKLAWW